MALVSSSTGFSISWSLSVSRDDLILLVEMGGKRVMGLFLST